VDIAHQLETATAEYRLLETSYVMAASAAETQTALAAFDKFTA
jgi:hypothetical protein